MLQQTQGAVEFAWNILPEHVQERVDRARCEHYTGSGSCPSLIVLVTDTLEEAEVYVALNPGNAVGFINETLRYIVELLDLIGDYGVAVPGWVSFIFQILPMIVPLLL